MQKMPGSELMIDGFRDRFPPALSVGEQNGRYDQGFGMRFGHIRCIPQEPIYGKFGFVFLDLHYPKDDLVAVEAEQDRHVQRHVAIGESAFTGFLPDKLDMTNRNVCLKGLRQNPFEGFFRKILEQVFEVLVVGGVHRNGSTGFTRFFKSFYFGGFGLVFNPVNLVNPV